MAYLPLNYDKINLIEGTYQPSQIKNNSVAFDYWVRSLFERATSNLIFGLPEAWQGDIANFWYYCMVRFGFVSIQDLTGRGKHGDEIGLCFSPVNLSGINFYYQRTIATISNPTIDESYELEMTVFCAVLHLIKWEFGI